MIYKQEIGEFTIVVSPIMGNVTLGQLCTIYRKSKRVARITISTSELEIINFGPHAIQIAHSGDFIRALQIGIERTREIFNNRNSKV